jgi:hypothetical protein
VSNLFVLIRRVSSYTHHDLLLGVFHSRVQAEESRDEYIEAVMRKPDDPWARQAYAIVSDDDVEILDDVPLISLSPSADRVFVVSSYAEGFGQVVRKLEALLGTHAEAHAHAEALEASDEGDFPYSCQVDEVPTGKLSTDAHGYGRAK